MKKVIVLCFVVMVFLVPTSLFGSCSGKDDENGVNGPDDPDGPYGPNCTKPTSPDYYTIRFTLDGSAIDQQDIILNFSGDSDDPILALWTDLDWMEMSGWYCKGGTVAEFPTFEMWARPMFYTPGVYEGVYGRGEPGPIGYIESTIKIIEDDIEYDYWLTDGTLTITMFGNVGGDVEGTFDFTYELAEPAPSFGTPLTALGEFRVLRLTDQ